VCCRKNGGKILWLTSKRALSAKGFQAWWERGHSDKNEFRIDKSWGVCSGRLKEGSDIDPQCAGNRGGGKKIKAKEKRDLEKGGGGTIGLAHIFIGQRCGGHIFKKKKKKTSFGLRAAEG